MAKKTETKPMPSETPAAPPAPAAAPADTAPKIHLDETAAKLAYANFFNITSTREETAIIFGLIQPRSGEQKDVHIDVGSRVLMTPHAARRLETMLGQVLRQYEARFGPLGDGATQ
jgi:hypothetical protein